MTHTLCLLFFSLSSRLRKTERVRDRRGGGEGERGRGGDERGEERREERMERRGRIERGSDQCSQRYLLFFAFCFLFLFFLLTLCFFSLLSFFFLLFLLQTQSTKKANEQESQSAQIKNHCSLTHARTHTLRVRSPSRTSAFIPVSLRVPSTTWLPLLSFVPPRCRCHSHCHSR